MTIASVPAFGHTVGAWAWFMPLPLMLCNVVVTVWMFRVGQGGQRAVGPAARREVHGDATPDEAWKAGGLFYFNYPAGTGLVSGAVFGRIAGHGAGAAAQAT